MNGFTNAILSLLLSWIRIFINQIWRLLSSGGSNSFFDFLAANWLTIVIVLCLGGFVADRLVYLFRWRPYYVWLSRRRQRRAQRYSQEPLDEETPQWSDDYPMVMDEPPPPTTPPIPTAPLPYATAAYDAVYQRPVMSPPMETDAATTHYAPIAHGTQHAAAYMPPYTSPNELSPVFDDDMGGWDEGDALLQQPGMNMSDLTGNMESDFGASKPEPIDYIRDMQAGFAKPLPPEQLYRPAAAPMDATPMEDVLSPVNADAPVHPGLDIANFRRNIGLSPAGALHHTAEESTPPEPDESVPGFTATRHIFSGQSQSGRSHNPFASLAKKARDFVGVDDADDRRSIHDLQPPVDLRDAFHEPVYPKTTKEDDDLSTY